MLKTGVKPPAMCSHTGVDNVDTLGVTRRALHGVAELVLAGPQYRRAGTIRLRITPGGFSTVREPVVAVEDAEVVGAEVRLPASGRSCEELAAALGARAGAPEGLYQDGSGVRPDEILAVDPAAAGYLADCFALGDAALRLFAADAEPVLWPEHFDLGITIEEINYGVSAGDGFSATPYAYVGPWRARTGEFWNAPFGATRALSSLSDAATVAAFFAEGRARAA
jgi:hypothetical protein